MGSGARGCLRWGRFLIPEDGRAECGFNCGLVGRVWRRGKGELGLGVSVRV